MQRLGATRHIIVKIMFLGKGERELFVGKLPIFTSYPLLDTNYVPSTLRTLSPVLTTMLYDRSSLLVIEEETETS